MGILDDFIEDDDYYDIDDNNDMLLWQKNHFFQTDRLCGLSPTVTRQIIRELTRNN